MTQPFILNEHTLQTMLNTAREQGLNSSLLTIAENRVECLRGFSIVQPQPRLCKHQHKNRVPTALAVISQMVRSCIPVSDWSNPHAIVFDPAGGTGAILLDAIKHKFSGLWRFIPNPRSRIQAALTLTRWNDIDRNAGRRFIAQVIKQWGHLGVTKADVQRIMTYKNALKLTRADVLRLDQLAPHLIGFEVLTIIMNPPYNGIDFDKVPGVFHPFCPNGNEYDSYYPFIALERSLLKDGERLIAIAPCKWLTERAAAPLRRGLQRDGGLISLAVNPQPSEWDGQVQTGQIVVFVFEKGRKEHASSVFCMPDGRFPNVNDPEMRDDLKKVLEMRADFPGIEFRRGSHGTWREDKNAPTQEYLHGGIGHYNERKIGRIVISPKEQAQLDQWRREGKVLLVYPNYQRSPFKIKGKNPKRVKVHVQVVPPMPMHDTYVYVVVAPDDVDRMKELLDSALAKLVFRSFFDTRHFAPALTGLLPNVCHLLPPAPTEADINNVYHQTPREVELLNRLARTFGKDM